jgi:hypothetical protein
MHSVGMLLWDIAAAEDSLQLTGVLGGEAHGDPPLNVGKTSAQSTDS